MEAITSKEGTKGVMISGDEVEYVIIRGDKKIDLYLKPKGRWTFKFTDEGVTGDPDAIFHVGPAEELLEESQESS